MTNNKQYVGQTWQSLRTRWRSHYSDAKRRINKFTAAILKYGKDSFRIELITLAHTQEMADYWESYFINKYDTIKSGYNLREGGNNSKNSKESNLKNSFSHRGSKNYSAILTENDVINIVDLLSQNKEEQEIAALYNVKPKTISNIKNGTTWKHILDSINYLPPAVKHNGKLIASQVDKIKQLLADGMEGKKIAKLFSITPSMVSCIKLGKTWK
jgi:DNA-binding CsgD family transcriptional regulator